MLLIRNGYVVDPASGLEGIRDILIEKGMIRQIKEPGACRPSSLPDDRVQTDQHQTELYQDEPHPEDLHQESLQTIDADGLIVAPGLVDTHVHFRDPGFPLKEDMVSGSAAAAKGGFTSVVMMANTRPPIDCLPVLEDVLTRSRPLPVHVYSAANVSVQMAGRELTDMEALSGAGAAVFTDDGIPLLDADLVRSALRRAKALGKVVSLHEEDPAYIHENGINAGGPGAARYGITGSDRMAEISMIRRDVAIAVEENAALCIQHISTAEGVDLVREARRHNPRIMAEATPQHFSLTEEAVVRTGTAAKVNPPLRTERDRQAILDGLCDGTIRIIATDHAPHTQQEKAAEPAWKAPSGMIGLETALSLGLRELVNSGRLPLSRFLALMTCNPADYYNLPAGHLDIGIPADLCIFDPAARWTVTDRFASRSCNSPFIGETLPGVVRYTISAGRVVYKNIVIIQHPHSQPLCG